VAAGIKRIVANEIDSAKGRLSGKGENLDEDIHEIRKSVKKTRAILKLIKEELGTDYRAENRMWRDVGRPLSEIRDSAALLGSLDALCHKYAGRNGTFEAAPFRDVLVRRKEEAYRSENVRSIMEKVLPTLRDAEKRFKAWDLNGADFALIAPGFEEAYRAGRRALARVKKDPSSENFHEVRKRVKDHWYHVRLLEDVWPEILRPYEKVLDDMQEWLGEDHNLTVLRDLIPQVADGRLRQQHIRSLARLIGQYQDELRNKSLAAAERVYAEKPHAFAVKVGRLWDAAASHITARKNPSARKSRRDAGINDAAVHAEQVL
jgi:CHAD domain-containing protein